MPEVSIDKLFEEFEGDLDFEAEYILSEVAEKLSTAIRSWRESRGLSQQELAEKLGTQQSRVSKLEDPDYGRYTMSTLAKIAVVLKVKLEVNLVPDSSESVIMPSSKNVPNPKTYESAQYTFKIAAA
jgi:transcriptional regulator with XRE-family HTH domain